MIIFDSDYYQIQLYHDIIKFDILKSQLHLYEQTNYRSICTIVETK